MTGAVIGYLVWASGPSLFFLGLAAAQKAWARHVDARYLAAPLLTDAVPIERLAADLRRLRPSVTAMEEQTVSVSAVKQLTVLRVYDDRLDRACRALEVPHQLRVVPFHERAGERRRVERALADAGLQVG